MHALVELPIIQRRRWAEPLTSHHAPDAGRSERATDQSSRPRHCQVGQGIAPNGEDKRGRRLDLDQVGREPVGRADDAVKGQDCVVDVPVEAGGRDSCRSKQRDKPAFRALDVPVDGDA